MLFIVIVHNMQRNSKINFLILFLLATLLGVYYSFLIHTSSNDLVFIIYGSKYCDACIALEEFLCKEVRGARVVFLDLTDENNSARFVEIISILYKIGVLRWQTSCPTCKTHTGYLRVLMPLTGILKNGELKAIVVGFNNQTMGEEVLSLVLNSNATYFIAPGVKIQIKEYRIREKLEKLILGSLLGISFKPIPA